MIYLDNASTTFPYDNVLQTLSDKQYYFNASNLYNQAEKSKTLIEDVRKICLNKLQAKEGTMIFTSGGCESNTTMLRSVIWKHLKDETPPHIITSSIEHHSILSCLEMYEQQGLCSVTYIKPDKVGRIYVSDVEKAITKNTKLITIMHVNNELGTINDINRIGRVAHKNNILFGVDAVQSFTKIPISIEFCDFVSFSAHKFHGPKGIGGLYVKDINNIIPLINGGNQEFGVRAGTYNVSAIVGMGKAISLAPSEKEQMDKYTTLKEYTIDRILDNFKGHEKDIHINGLYLEPTPVLNFSIEGIIGEAVTLKLAEKEIFISNGSACNTGDLKPSYVLTAIGRSETLANSAMRLSFSYDTSYIDIDIFIAEFLKIYKEYV